MLLPSLRMFCVVFLLAGVLQAQESLPADGDTPPVFNDETEANEDEFSRQPLFLGPPFNRLTLTSHYNSVSFNVQPIAFPGGSRPNPLPRFDELSVYFVDNPLKEFVVKWNFVEKIDLFHELVLEEYEKRLTRLSELVRNLSPEDEDWAILANRFDLLFDYLRFLSDYKKELPGYEAAYRKYLFEEAVYRIKSRDDATGLARFITLFQIDRNYPGLNRACSSALNRVLKKEFEAGNYVKCRQYLRRFETFLPEHPVVLDWQAKLQGEAAKQFEEAKRAESETTFLSAHRRSEEAQRIDPNLPGLISWRKTLQEQAPQFRIAVNVPLSGKNEVDPSPLPDAANLRTGRIVRPRLCEFERPSLNGGVYRSSFARLERSENHRELTWHFERSSQPERLRTDLNDLSETLETLRRGAADPDRSPTLLSTLFLSQKIDPAEARVTVRLTRPFPLPEALFAVPILSSVDSVDTDDAKKKATKRFRPGKFLRVFSEGDENGFETAEYVAQTPSVLLERTILRSEEAVEALLSGRVDVIDRLAPWEMERLSRNPNFNVGRYTVPTVHFLVPNPDKSLTAGRTFRRALLYGLNRQGMLDKLLEKDGEGIVSSVPFIRGTSLGDPLGYGCDPMIRPRPYEPKLALALSLSTFNQIRNREPGWEEITAIPELVLARPAHETAEYVALLLRRQWSAVGISVKVVDYHASEEIGRSNDVDLWLVERTVKEPLVDAEKIFGTDGLCGTASPYMDLALQKLRHAEDWPTAARCLQEIHRLCFEETTVLPLWQIYDHYAHRADLTGVTDEDGILDLYENLPRWRLSPSP